MSRSPSIVRTAIDRAALTAFAARTNTLDDDLGYALHLALRRRFGADGPQPFRRIEAERERTQDMLLGYAADPSPILAAAPPAPPEPFDSMGDWSAVPDESLALLRRIFPRPFEAKPMPGVSDWRTGQRLAFEVLVRPVRRHSAKVKALRKESGKHAGGERDAFLSAVETLEKGTHAVTRHTVYSGWLAAQLGNAATLERCALTRFRRSRVVRSASGGRFRGKGIEGPEALMEGVLVVREPEALVGALARGIGRHTAFGYGMLLLRPPGR